VLRSRWSFKVKVGADVHAGQVVDSPVPQKWTAVVAGAGQTAGMKRSLPILGVLLVLVLAGCSDDTPSAAPNAATPAVASPSASPTPPPSDDRATCHQVSVVEAVSVVAHLEPARSRPVAAAALLSVDQDMRGAGMALDATLDALADDSNESTRKELEVSRAWRYVAEACIGLYGNGPW
jgi:hypothetical protein